jgi:hypothetical protein
MRMRFVITALAISFALFRSQPVLAWGCVGHQVVAYIANGNLSVNAAAQLADLLKDADYSVKRFCAATI